MDDEVFVHSNVPVTFRLALKHVHHSHARSNTHAYSVLRLDRVGAGGSHAALLHEGLQGYRVRGAVRRRVGIALCCEQITAGVDGRGAVRKRIGGQNCGEIACSETGGSELLVHACRHGGRIFEPARVDILDDHGGAIDCERPPDVVFRVQGEIDARVEPEPEFVIVMIDSIFSWPRRGDVEVLTLLNLERGGVGSCFGGAEIGAGSERNNFGDIVSA